MAATEHKAAVPSPGVLRHATAFMPAAAFLALLAALAVANPDLLQVASLLALADSAAPLATLAAGATIVVLCGGIDLSIAALASLASVLLASWAPALGAGAVPAVIAATALAGALQGSVHVAFRIPSFVVTLGGMTLWSALALLASGAATVPMADSSPTDWAFTRLGGIVPSAVLVALAALALLTVAMRLSPLGRYVAAIGHAEPAARLAGVPVARVKTLAFTLSGACAGLAGTLLVARTFSGAPTLADSLLLPAVAAIVVGGTAITGGHGALWRTLVGAGIVTLLRVGLSLAGIDAAYESILYGVLIIAAVALTIDRSKLSIVK
ncbi:ABC transporter permease [Nonomuraea sp. NPDC050663]|uniref:ABC transporter permease n=1 Tax=Nonomuraea sp. NPDC050663 TaxID=3364370 RepID=UPI003790A594